MQSGPPDHVLPPTTSVDLATKSGSVARGIAAHVSESRERGPSSSQTRAPAVSSSPLPAGSSKSLKDVAEALARKQAADEDGWSPGEYLRNRAPQVRKTGASLAGAALKKLGG